MELNEAILKSIQILNEERTRPTVSFEPVIGALSRHSLHAERQKNYNVLGAGLGNPGNFGNPRGPRESSRTGIYQQARSFLRELFRLLRRT